MVTSRMDAKAIKWLDSLSVWSVTNYSIRDFDKNGSVMNTTVSKKDTLLNLNFLLKILLNNQKNPMR